MSERYTLVEHTADIAVRFSGKDLAELLVTLAFTVTDLLAAAASVKPEVELAFLLDAPDEETLLVVLANELIYRRDAEDLLLPELTVDAIDGLNDGGVRVRATARGERADPTRHELRAGLKAATFHELAITPQPDGTLEAFLVFDV